MMYGLVNANLLKLLKKKPTNPMPHWDSMYPFHIKDQWAELKNMSLLETKQKVLTQSDSAPRISFLPRDAKKNKETPLELFSYFKRNR